MARETTFPPLDSFFFFVILLAIAFGSIQLRSFLHHNRLICFILLAILYARTLVQHIFPFIHIIFFFVRCAHTSCCCCCCCYSSFLFRHCCDLLLLLLPLFCVLSFFHPLLSSVLYAKHTDGFHNIAFDYTLLPFVLSLQLLSCSLSVCPSACFVFFHTINTNTIR